MSDAGDDELPKPRELLAAHDACAELFALLQQWFAVPERVTIDLARVDSAVAELADPQLVMAMAMRKLQALHLLTTPGVATTSDVVLTVIQDLERALLQAPTMHLKQLAAEVDWDAELATLGLDAPLEDDDLDTPAETGTAGPAADAEAAGAEAADAEAADADAFADGGNRSVHDEVARFRAHHATLHEAAKAVLHVSDGRIRRLR